VEVGHQAFDSQVERLDDFPLTILASLFAVMVLR
jgi:hypothetical protein